MSIPPFFEPIVSFFSADPTLRVMQLSTALLVMLLLFFLFYTLKDIVRRTHSFFYQFVCIVLVALLPFVGFLLYILIRPSRTLKEREMEAMLRRLVIGEEVIDVPAEEHVNESAATEESTSS